MIPRYCCIILVVLDQVDDHDLIKQLRWRRKRKGEYKQIAMKSYVKGKVIDGEHELYTLSIAVMIGVRTSISRTNTELNSGPSHRWIRPMDFRTTEKYEFRPKGGSLTPPHMLKHTFKFKDYAPVAFAYLRRMFGINEFDFLLSVCGNANFIEFISNAKSGQFFFYSNDGRYMIKTMTNAESKFLRRSKCASVCTTALTKSVCLFSGHASKLTFYPVLFSHFFLNFFSSPRLFQTLCRNAQNHGYPISRHVSCQAVSFAKKYEICYYEFCLLHRQVLANFL